VKGKYKVRLRTGHKSHEDYRYSCTPSFTLVLDVLDGQRQAPTAYPGNEPVPIVQEAG